MDTNQIITGDCLERLAELPANSVHCVMTSPPYWNLRDYDHQDQLGLEETPEEYINNIADVMDAVGRVLREDGSLWLNLGDTYENKDCQMIPQRVALELQNRGWTLRNKVVWAKPNPMPQSVKDRLNDTTERIYHFVQQKDYFYDLDSIREEHAEGTVRNANNEGYQPMNHDKKITLTENGDRNDGGREVEYSDMIDLEAGKNPGDVFEVTSKPFPDAHFAVYPPGLCQKPIKATCPEDGIVLDPFAGAGTTLLKAKELGRKYIGIELNPEYADMARTRVGLTPNNPETLRENENQEGLEAYE